MRVNTLTLVFLASSSGFAASTEARSGTRVEISRTLERARAHQYEGSICISQSQDSSQVFYALKLTKENFEQTYAGKDGLCFDAVVTGGCNCKAVGWFNSSTISDSYSYSLKCQEDSTDEVTRLITIGPAKFYSVKQEPCRLVR